MPAYDQFYQLLSDHSSRTAATYPDDLIAYLSELLASKLTCTDLIPDQGWGSSYLELNTLQDYVRYADDCLFFTSILPEYGRRRGLSLDYYAGLGIGAYYRAGDLSFDHRYTQLGNWFYYLQAFLTTSIHGGEFSCWDKLRS